MIHPGHDARLREVLGAEALGTLASSTVAVIGAGVTGGRVAHELAPFGGRLVIVDPDVIDPVNLGSGCFPAAAVGDPKARVRAWQIRLVAPAARVEAIEARVEDLGRARLARADLLVCATDARKSRAHLNELSLELGIPWLNVALDGSGRESLGTVAYYDPRVPGSACYACRYDDGDLAILAREGRSGCPSWRDPSRSLSAPTLVTGSFAALVGGFASLWSIDALLGRAADRAGHELLITARPPGVRIAELSRSSRCTQDHARLEPLRLASASTLGGVFERAARDLGCEPEALVIHGGRALVSGLRCSKCGARREVARLAHALSDADVHCECGGELAPVSLSDRIPADRARSLAPAKLADLGFPEEDIVCAVAGASGVHYVIRPRAGQLALPFVQEARS